MPRYIDADALIKRLKKIHCKTCDNHDGQNCIGCSISDEIDDLENALKPFGDDEHTTSGLLEEE